jgi:hypothetical protein
MLPGLKSCRLDHRSDGNVELQRAPSRAAAESVAGVAAPPAASPNLHGLSDRDPMFLIRTYRFSLAFLLKSPCPFVKTTRSPPVVQKYLQIGPVFSF